jgi:hypothetical protein
MPIAYIIKNIDIDGDQIPDGDLFLKFKYSKRNGKIYAKLLSAKYLNNKEIKSFVKELNGKVEAKVKTTTDGGARKRKPRQKIVYVEKPVIQQQQPIPVVQVQDTTTFAHSLKLGFAYGMAGKAGSMVTEAVVGGIASLFSE